MYPVATSKMVIFGSVQWRLQRPVLNIVAQNPRKILLFLFFFLLVSIHFPVLSPAFAV